MTTPVQFNPAQPPVIAFGCAKPQFSAAPEKSGTTQAKAFHQCVTFGCCGGDRLEKKFQAQ